jgi:hypothetical protein
MKAYLIKPDQKGIVQTTVPWLAENMKYIIFCYGNYLDILGASLEAIYSPYQRTGAVVCDDIHEAMETLRLLGYRSGMAVYSNSTKDSVMACFQDANLYPKVVERTLSAMLRDSSKAFFRNQADLIKVFPVTAVNHDLIEKEYFLQMVFKDAPKLFSGKVMENNSQFPIEQLAEKARQLGIFYLFEKRAETSFFVLSTDGTTISGSTLTNKSTAVYEDRETTINELWKHCILKAVKLLQYQARKRGESVCVIDEVTISDALSIPSKSFQEAWNMLSSKRYNS